MQRCIYLACLAMALLSWAGCATVNPGRTQPIESTEVAKPPSPDDENLVFPERLPHGYTLFFPGIWGNTPIDYGIVRGLKRANVDSAIEVYDWTTGPLLFLYNLRASKRNEEQAQKIVAKIVSYEQQYPGRPVHLIGYSGGGSMAVMTLEALPPEHPVTDAILLAPALAMDHDLGRAISRTQKGIHNFYSSMDVPLLVTLCTLIGTSDGEHTLPAGTVGFLTSSSPFAAAVEGQGPRLVQEHYRFGMLRDGHWGGHFGWSTGAFARDHIAPIMQPDPPRREGDVQPVSVTLPISQP